jgi:hypothetical protein
VGTLGRSWSSRLLLVAAGFGVFGAAAHFQAWTMGVSVLLALLATSYAVATFGPRSVTERYTAVSTADATRALPTYRDA